MITGIGLVELQHQGRVHMDAFNHTVLLKGLINNVWYYYASFKHRLMLPDGFLYNLGH